MGEWSTMSAAEFGAVKGAQLDLMLEDSNGLVCPAAAAGQLDMFAAEA
jgi:hypothetical protein